jgi:hypothetical protein
MAVGMLAGCSSTSNIGVVHAVLGVNEVDAGGGVPLTSHFVPLAGVVRVVQGSKVMATATVGKNGRASFRLAPGTYRLEGTSLDLPGVKCAALSHVLAHADSTVSVKVICTGGPTGG